MKLGELVTYFKANTRDLDQAVSHMKRQGQNMKKFGRQMSMSVSLPLAVMGGVAIKTFAGFEAGMNKVRAVSGATGEQFQQLTTLARELGGATKFTAKEASEGMGFLAMAGFEVEEIMSALPATLDLAAAGEMELGRSADIVSNIMQGFGIETTRTAEIADILTASFTSANTSLEQIGEAMSYAAPTARGFGQSIETAAAAVGILGDAGIQGSRAGTNLSRILTMLTKKSKQLGIDVFDSSGKMRDFADLLEVIQREGLGAEQIMKDFGQIAGPAMLVLLERGSEGFREFRDEIKDSAGATKKAAGTMMEGITGAFTELKSAVSEAMISFIEPFAASIERLVDKVKGLVQWFGNLSTATKKTIGIIGLLTAAIGPLSLALGILAADIIPRLIKGFKLLWVTMSKNPYLLLGAVLAYFIAKLIKVKTATNKAKDGQKEYNDVLLEAKQLLEDTQPIEKRMKVLSSLNKRQLGEFKQRIETRLNLEQDYTVNLKTELSKRLAEDEKLNTLKEKYAKAVSEGAVDFYLIGLDNQIKYRKIAIKEELEVERKGNEERLAQLQKYLKQVEKQIEITADEVEDNPFEIEVDVTTPSGILSEMHNELSKINELQKILGEEYDTNTQKASVYLSAIKALVNTGLTAESSAIQEIVNRLQGLQGEYDKIASKTMSDIYAPDDDASELDDMSGWLKENSEGLREFGNISKETMTGIYSVAQGAFSGMQNVISNAFDGSKNILEGFGEFFKKFIAGLIAKLIAATIAAAILSVILNSITGGAAGGTGAVKQAMSFGKIFKGLIGFGSGGGVQGLQTGGIVTKPGVFEVGERGRETVYLPAGAAVTPNTKEQRKKPQVVIFKLEGRTLADALISQEKYEQSY